MFRILCSAEFMLEGLCSGVTFNAGRHNVGAYNQGLTSGASFGAHSRRLTFRSLMVKSYCTVLTILWLPQ